MKLSELTANYLFLLDKGFKCKIVDELDDDRLFLNIYDDAGQLNLEIGSVAATEQALFIYGCTDVSNDTWRWAYLWRSRTGFESCCYETPYNFIQPMQGHEEYLRYLWITNLENGSGRETIYVPTEAGLPILEANRLKAK